MRGGEVLLRTVESKCFFNQVFAAVINPPGHFDPRAAGGLNNIALSVPLSLVAQHFPKR